MTWTTERAQQLAKLEDLLSLVHSLNRRSHFIQAVQESIQTAEELVDDEFVQFLRELCVKERQEHLERTGELP